MPYIKKVARQGLNDIIQSFEGINILTPGELNYLITKLTHHYLGDNPSYNRYNDVIGALECAKMELYRRKVIPYEQKKIQENGDV